MGDIRLGEQNTVQPQRTTRHATEKDISSGSPDLELARASRVWLLKYRNTVSIFFLIPDEIETRSRGKGFLWKTLIQMRRWYDIICNT